MKRKRLQKMIALAVCTAVITTMGGFSAAAEEVYEVAADEETVTDVPAEPETEDIFQEVGEDEEQPSLLRQRKSVRTVEGDIYIGYYDRHEQTEQQSDIGRVAQRDERKNIYRQKQCGIVDAESAQIMHIAGSRHRRCAGQPEYLFKVRVNDRLQRCQEQKSCHEKSCVQQY